MSTRSERYREQLEQLRAMEPVELLACCIRGEAENQTYTGKFAIGCAVRNRVLIPRWWGSIYHGVVLHPLQFSCFNENETDRLIPRMLNPPDTAAWRDCQRAAAAVVAGELDITGGANHYHTVDKPSWADVWPPVWTRTMVKTCVIGDHVFYDDLGTA